MKSKCCATWALSILLSVALSLLSYLAILHFGPISVKTLFIHPKGVMESVQYAQAQEQERTLKASQKKAKELVESESPLLFTSLDPVLGKTDGKIVIIEFFDYLCGYCKKIEDSISDVLSKPKYKNDVTVRLKPLPIFGRVSIYLAGNMIELNRKNQKLFRKLHKKLFNEAEGIKTIEDAEKFFIKNGYSTPFGSVEEISEDIANYLNESRRLSLSDIGITGTPSLIIGTEFIPGYINKEQLEQKINDLL